MRNCWLSILLLACRAVAFGVGGSILASVCLADQRHFTFVYEATIEEPGEFELENWATSQIRKNSDHGFVEADFRHEIEFGVIDNLQASVYLADWSYLSSRTNNGFVFSDAALELIYQIRNPEKAPIGLAVYEEIEGGDRIFGSESKLIVQKNFARFVLAYNATLEAIWQGRELAEREAEFQQTFGASYQLNRCISIGGELVHEMAFPEWSDAERPVISGGPNASLHCGKWWGTLTALAQWTRARDEPEVQLRAITGYSF